MAFMPMHSVALGAEHGKSISYQQLALIGSSNRSKNIKKLVKEVESLKCLWKEGIVVVHLIQ